MNNIYYVYIYLDPREPGNYTYDNIKFEFKPFYVGKGKEDRMYAHISSRELSKNSYKSNKIKKILSSGSKPIIIKVYENVSECKSLDIEKDLIRKIGMYKNGGILTNQRPGGVEAYGYKHNYDSIQKQIDKQNYPVQKILYNKVIKEYASVKTCTECEEFSNNFIINCCKGRSKPKDGTDFRYKEIKLRNKYKEIKKSFKHIKQNKEVFYFNKKYELIGKFNSIREAHRKTNISRKFISSCCKSMIRTSKNKFYFSFTDTYEIPLDIRKPKREVSKIRLNGTVIETYESVSYAARINNISRCGINAVLSKNNIQKTAGGYFWK